MDFRRLIFRGARANVNEAKQELDGVLDNREKVEEITKELRERGRRNHFAEALTLAYERRPSDQPHR